MLATGYTTASSKSTESSGSSSVQTVHHHAAARYTFPVYQAKTVCSVRVFLDLEVKAFFADASSFDVFVALSFSTLDVFLGCMHRELTTMFTCFIPRA